MKKVYCVISFNSLVSHMVKQSNMKKKSMVISFHLLLTLRACVFKHSKIASPHKRADTLFHRKEPELPVQSARKFSAVLGTTFANSCKQTPRVNMVHVTMSSTAKTASRYAKSKTKHAAANFTTSNVILSALPPPIDMSMKT
jgi:hypothetical protein